MSEGKKLRFFLLVRQYEAFVFKAKSLYLTESKNVISPNLASPRDLML